MMHKKYRAVAATKVVNALTIETSDLSSIPSMWFFFFTSHCSQIDPISNWCQNSSEKQRHVTGH
uniref:Uncharacterized protein n=1 Tax=Arion vulgaris TaxID=1028688 RepID=A0A0B6YEQ4_9EUPU